MWWNKTIGYTTASWFHSISAESGKWWGHQKNDVLFPRVLRFDRIKESAAFLKRIWFWYFSPALFHRWQMTNNTVCMGLRENLIVFSFEFKKLTGIIANAKLCGNTFCFSLFSVSWVRRGFFHLSAEQQHGSRKPSRKAKGDLRFHLFRFCLWCWHGKANPIKQTKSLVFAERKRKIYHRSLCGLEVTGNSLVVLRMFLVFRGNWEGLRNSELVTNTPQVST